MEMFVRLVNQLTLLHGVPHGVVISTKPRLDLVFRGNTLRLADSLRRLTVLKYKDSQPVCFVAIKRMILLNLIRFNIC